MTIEAGTIPSVEEANEGAVAFLPPTVVIPGSDVQENTAIRQAPRLGLTRPDLGQSHLSTILQGLQIIGAGFGDLESKTGAANKTVELLKGLRDDRNARASLGYLTRLQALTAQDASKAPAALEDLNDFIALNAENIPMPVQAVASKLVDQFKEQAAQYTLGHMYAHFQEENIAPKSKFDYFNRALSFALGNGLPFKEAVQFAKSGADTIPEIADQYTFQNYPEQDITIRENKKTGERDVRRISSMLPGSEEGGTVPAFPTHPLEVNKVATPVIEQAARDQVDLPRLFDRMRFGKAEDRIAAQKEWQQLQQRSDQFEENKITKLNQAKKEVVPIPAEMQLMLPGGTAPQTMEQLTTAQKKTIVAERQKLQVAKDTDAALSRGAVLYDETGQAHPEWSGSDHAGGKGILVSEKNAKSIDDTLYTRGQIHLVAAMAKRINQNVSPGTNFLDGWKSQVRAGLALPGDERIFNAIVGTEKEPGPLADKLLRDIVQNRIAVMQLPGGVRILPMFKDTVAVVQQKLEVLDFMGELSTQTRLHRLTPERVDQLLKERFPRLFTDVQGPKPRPTQTKGGLPIEYAQ